ncbi:MAG: M48 family metalloprotease [Desulfobacterales bacterium]
MLKKMPAAFLAALMLLTLVFPNGRAGAITVGEEEVLSREFMAMVRQQLDLIEDPMVVDYVNRVGQRIVAHLPPQPFRFHFYVVNEHVYNAFASPAGHIFINSGLLENLGGEDGLAGILAHEIGHVTARHISDRIARSQKIGAATLAGIVAAALLGPAAGSAAAQALTVGSLAAGQSLTLAYSRQDELQADQLGLQYLKSAGYSARGLLSALQLIRSKNWFGDVPNYLMTHPAVEDRLALIDTWMENSDTSTRNVDPYAFQKMQTRLIALYGDAQNAKARYERMIAGSDQEALGQYGMGLLQARAGNRQEALACLKKALSLRPFDSDFLTDLGRVYYQDGQYGKALEILESAENLPPFDPERSYYLGQARMQTGQLDRAVWTLENLVSQRPAFIPAYYALGEVYSRLDKKGEAHYNLGIYYKQKGDVKNAVFHLTRARELLTQDSERRRQIDEFLKEARLQEKKMEE